MPRPSGIQLAATRPRNPVVRALVYLARSVGKRHAPSRERRAVDLDRLDPDARVREIGEW
ncbi:hypothetical protein [Ramlibacter humi]|uniref:Uncharacterized protein n=1 Tax=Ramlibacter humi TaxID=2530451 RepID=A0A4Z0BNU1_9BURK|nr:hypothetical protein [Ramlibacter humi]TFZ00094.1 hypothetical protein EZ216_13375 [Ramlibacter humi]